jgi:hypothetical protein
VEHSYGNPANWTAGGLVELIHRGPDGTLSTLGIFQESFYRKTGARKLSRFSATPSPASPPAKVEFVSGDWWLSPYCKPTRKFEDTPDELLALLARFEELMEQFEEELEEFDPSGSSF